MGPISPAVQQRRAFPVPGSGSKSRTVNALAMPPTTPGDMRGLAAADQKRARRRDDLIASHMPMATRIAHSFSGRGQDIDDLTQVAMLELVRAAGQFDPERGAAFAQYAYPCIVGGVKRHFRDNGWGMHITRRMQELYLQTSRAVPELTQLLGRMPTVPDLAVHLRLSEQDVRDGMDSRWAYKVGSLNLPVGRDDDAELGQLLGGPDGRLEAVPDRHLLARCVAELPARQQSILYLRFTNDLTQREIAERLGISQMHVSRLLSRSLELLRSKISAR